MFKNLFLYRIFSAANAVSEQHVKLIPTAEEMGTPMQPQYSLDADPQGIRARVVSAVIGAMAYGARGEYKPPEGHWLNEVWDIARAEAVQQEQDSLMKKAYERGWIECACWANRDDLRTDVGSPAYLADRAPHIDAVKNGWPLGCEKCIDPDGIPCFPQYGVGPHTCFYKIPGAKVGESQPLPKDQWPDNYREDPNCPGMGVYWCPHCGSGKPAAPEAA